MYENLKYVENICIFTSFLTHDIAQRIALNNGLNESSDSRKKRQVRKC